MDEKIFSLLKGGTRVYHQLWNLKQKNIEQSIKIGVSWFADFDLCIRFLVQLRFDPKSPNVGPETDEFDLAKNLNKVLE